MKKQKAVLLVSLLLAADVFALPAGGRIKKHIGLAFDVMSTTPSNILANADQFAEHAPYLDGVAISLNKVPLTDRSGAVVTGGVSTIMSATERWTRDAVKEHIPVLREIVKKPHLSECFLLFWMTPKYYDTRLDWADDEAWANFAENMASVAWLAKEGGMKGLMLDPEEYAVAHQYRHTSKDPPFPETVKLARQRGREVFSRVFREYPDMTLFTLWFFGCYRGYVGDMKLTNPVNSAEDRGDLLHHFYNGMLDVLPPGARVVDGCEHYSLSATRYQYLYNANSISTGLLPFVAPENVDKYRSQMLVSNTFFLDMYAQEANPKSHWYHGPVNGSRLEHLRLNFQQSLLTATEYVWVYAENGGKLFPWRDGHYAKKKTWEEAIPGMTETLMLVKDPERWAAMRRDKLSSEGALVNLVADAKPVKLDNPTKLKKYGMAENKMPAVKNVKPGERYLVSVSVRESVGRRGKKGRSSSACPRMVWRKNGKCADIAPTPLKVPADAAEKWVRVEELVTIPEGVDEMRLDLAAELNANERVEYRSPSICNSFDPVRIEEAVPASKWVLDLKKRTLSNGHWQLKAFTHKGHFFVHGANSKTVGGGVLDLRQVKADTGYDIFEVGRFSGYDGITALVAPDVPMIEMRGFKGCTNLRAAICKDFTSPEKTPSFIDRRKAVLNQFGIRNEFADGRLRESYYHPSSVSRGFGREISVTDVKPGELYNVGVSMRRSGSGTVYLYARFLNDKGRYMWPKHTITMKQPREDGVWRDGEVVMRAPQGAASICFDISADIKEGFDVFEFDKFKIYKIGDPIPAWPAEYELEKGSARK